MTSWCVSQAVSVSARCELVCVGEWSGRQRTSTQIIHWCRGPSSLVCGWWWQRVGRGPLGSLRYAAWHSTTATTRPHWQEQPSTQAVVANTTMLQSSHVNASRCTQQQWVVVVVWQDHAISSDSWLLQCDWRFRIGLSYDALAPRLAFSQCSINSTLKLHT